MMIDTTYFGYGVGLVLLGWVLGLIANSVFSVLRKIGLISIFFFVICFSSSSYAGFSNYYNIPCTPGDRGVIHINYYAVGTPVAPDNVVYFQTNLVNRTAYLTPSGRDMLFDAVCESSGYARLSVVNSYSGTVDVTPQEWVSPIDPFQTEYSQLISLFLGGLCAFGFVYMSGSKIF